MLGCRGAASETPFQIPGQPKPGDSATYSFRYTNRSLSDIRPLLGDPNATPVPGMVHTFETELEGRLSVRVLSNGRLEAQVVLAKTRFEVDGEAEPTIQAALERELPNGAQFEFGPSGQISRTFLPKDAHRVVLGLWQVIATRWQWTRPPASEVRWETQEPDVNGEVRVAYASRPGGPAGGPLIERTREELLATEESGAEKTLTGGVTRFRFAPGQSLPESLEAEDRSELLRSGRPLGVSESTLNLKRETTDAKPPEAGSNRTFTLVLEKGLVSGLHLRDDLERSRLAGRKPAEVWAAYKRDSASAAGPKEAYLALKALLYLEPAQCKVALKELNQAAPDSSIFVGVAEALADSGHAEAQLALRTAFEHAGLAPRSGAILAGAMGALREPDATTIALLQDAAVQDSPAGDSAMLALGRIGNQKGKPAGFDAEPVVRWLKSQFESEAGQGRQAVTCLALGNTASPLVEDSILKAMASSDADLRGSAATSLRWMPSPKADEALRLALKSDADLDVRRKSAAAMSFRENEGNLVALLVAAADPTPALRMAVLSVLGGWSYADPRILEVLKRAAADADPDVRKLAIALLESRPPDELELKSP